MIYLLIFNYETKITVFKTLNSIIIFNLDSGVRLSQSQVELESDWSRSRVGVLNFYEVYLLSVYESDSDYIIEFGVGYFFSQT